MSLHLIKLCVGTDSIDGLASWQSERVAENVLSNHPHHLFHTTFQTPKRQSEVLDGGSLYWVMRGVILARQRITGFADGHKADGSPCCLLLLDSELVAVRPTVRRAFQGWRYLEPADAPPDIKGTAAHKLADMPARLRRELSHLGLL